MCGLNEITVLLLAQSGVDKPPNYILIGVILVIILVLVVSAVIKIRKMTQYDLDGSYGGGGGLSRIFRHKKLKKYDRDGLIRGRARMFEDAELKMLLDAGKVSEAAKYLTGVLKTAKEAGDKHTRRRYEGYYKELIEIYDEKELEIHGGKAIHSKK